MPSARAAVPHMSCSYGTYRSSAGSLTCCQQVLHTLDGQEPVGVLRLPDAVKEDGQVVVVVKLVQVNLHTTAAGPCYSTHEFIQHKECT